MVGWPMIVMPNELGVEVHGFCGKTTVEEQLFDPELLRAATAAPAPAAPATSAIHNHL
jgi:hypothetical protein